MRRLAYLGLTLALCAYGCDDGGMDDPDTGTGGTDSGMTRADAGGGGTDAGGGGGMDGGGGGTDAGDATDGGGGGTDAGDSTDASFAGCPAGTATIAETCPAFTACGGDVSGEWCYTNVCITEDEILGPARERCPSLTIRDVSGGVTGRVSFDSGTMIVTRDVRTQVSGVIEVPSTCVLGGCGTTEMIIEGALGPNATVTCTSAGGGCDCAIDFVVLVDNATTYSTAANVITTDPGGSSQRTYEYCVEGDGGLRFRETTGGSEYEPGIQGLAPDSAG